ncbi:tRNA (cytidine32/uridine32-2'-O)-methyltransferase [Moraxella cuniculi DSM 21768]|uniref:tRNA (cytidine/uridine-2'-O-)-methyltransferase TrmJ n=1 Tax=Moraxella cuniculi DSM 21768 TaxID=1122245 RepID=A0A1N7ET98_9GAMM|nr:TrmJ/YjtD family RNA methyltransferase [Moraxella cuniculi]OOS06340.1 RNA methyltransferase [Moraxella cuniculi]SIR91310.1 tRNA (cytidine32/uridine32-2'-O)-methyltransferase [Moraxella cuniculi DSM 21768]
MTQTDRLATCLAQIHTIMIGTTLPANIGSAARALHTMGLGNLTIINPRLPIDQSSIANAAGATCVLDNAVIADDLTSIINDCSLVFAASARSRQLPRPVVTPSMAADIAITRLLATESLATTQAHSLPKIAILFGREDRGLTNEELALAHYHIQIPANPAYPVLNVASAIQVIAACFYERFSAQFAHSPISSTKQTQGVAQTQYPLELVVRSDWDAPAITHQQADELTTALIALMEQLDLVRDDKLTQLTNRLLRLNQRLQLDQKEYALMRALIAKISTAIKTAT